MHELKLTVRTITPLFAAAADSDKPELREPSLKGLMRFWFRSFTADYAKSETAIMGGAGGSDGQSMFFLRVVPSSSTSRLWRWDRTAVNRFTEGQGKNAKNGIAYLANLAVPKRTAIAPGVQFDLRLVFPRREPKHEDRLAVLGSLWLLFHFGGAGSRSRRGFGSFCLERWEALPSADWPETTGLKLLRDCRNVQEARHAIDEAVKTLHKGSPPKDLLNPHIDDGKEFRYLVDPAGFPTSGSDAWAQALNEAGRALQDFRVRRVPDYEDVRAALSARRPPRQAPQRATFGLPIAFRFSSVSGTAQFSAFHGSDVGGDTSDRHASPLFIRVLRIGDRLHPAYFLLAGPVPAMGGNGTSAIMGQRGRPLDPPAVSALDDFMRWLPQRWAERGRR